MTRALCWMAWGVLASGCAPGCGQAPPELASDRLAASAASGDILVTYRDGQTVIGAIADEMHRLPLEYHQLPLAWQVAVVAAEDGRFWSHSGVSVRGVTRAVRDNLWAGTVVSGGSTITQQTVKNLLERRERTFEAKWRELDYAMHLEGSASKTQILTLYSNLFHVTGTGSGLGVAARYFFDSTPDELSVLQMAFVAGQIQAPAEFDPFEGSKAQQAAARIKAHARTTHVLKRIRDQRTGHLSPPDSSPDAVRALQAEAGRLLEEGFTIPFRRGSFRYAATTLVDEVARRLDTPAFQQVLTSAGVDPEATGGLTVVTTLDQTVQREATWGLWHRLTELGLRMEDVGVADLRISEADLAELPATDVWTEHAFGVGVVREHTATQELMVDVQGAPCLVDGTALQRIGKALGASSTQVSQALPDGSHVWVSQRGEHRCDLEVVPELQGAAVVLEDGHVRALVGGNTNRDFDRTRAARQFGSAFKPLVLHAAMTLGWKPDDLLANYPMPFTYLGELYEPRRDHEAPGVVTLSRAGSSSENIASVWLLVHLLDRLTLPELGKLAGQMGMAQQRDEPVETYRDRLRQVGVRVRRSDLGDIAVRIATSRFAEGRPVRGRAITRSVSSRAALDHAGSLLEDCEEQVASLRQAVATRQRPVAPDLSVRVTETGVDLACHVEWEEYQPVADFFPFSNVPSPSQRWAVDAPVRSGRKVKRGRRGKRNRDKVSTPPELPVAPPAGGLPELPDLELVYVGGDLRYGEVQTLQGLTSAALWDLQKRSDLYAPDVLFRHGDFRTLLALNYVKHLASQYGVQTELQPVLSLPLGASELNLQEMTAMYAGMLSGRAQLPAVASDVGPTLLIQEIRDRSGRVLYEAKTVAKPVVHPAVADQTADILRKVVDKGTGSRARGAVRVDGAAVPLGGKTGTTNDYRNAAFVGYLPTPAEGGYDPGHGHVIGVYVGYDDNREMKARGLRVTGSVGALPPFRSIATSLQAHLGAPAPTGVRPANGKWPLRTSAGPQSGS
ncbi:MAG: transglycosylase domain-containing protein [Myxococcales bacterium]|nr:transglycosylase domain-containing protein [Myxococcales bacterium]